VSEIKATLLRLRTSTTSGLKAELEHSAHRSMASLADELIERGLEELRHERLKDVAKAAGEVC
jgi:hypothetical protein